MNNEAEKLLMMFIKDSYKSSTGKVSKKTAIALMSYVSGNAGLSNMINSSDWDGVLNHIDNKEAK